MKTIREKQKMDAPNHYEDWKRYVFDRPSSEEPWYYDLVGDEFVASPTESVQLITYTFEHCGTELACFSDEQIGRGLTYLLDSGFSDASLALMNNQVSIDWRIQFRSATTC